MNYYVDVHANLLPELLDLMDEGKIAFSVGVELSYLPIDAQSDLLDAMGRSLRGRRESPERVLKLAALLDELRQAAAVNTGVGHLAGWLCAGAAQS